MPQVQHEERHFTSGKLVRDIVIGMSDGLTVPFALAAGLAAVAVPKIVVVAGFAEIAAGSIAMGLGGYLAAKGESEHYDHEFAREQREVVEVPEEEAREVAEVFRNYGLTADEAAPVVAALRQRSDDWIDFMMRFELGLERPDPKRAVTSAGTIAASYIVGGIIPLSPYIAVSFTGHTAHAAFLFSVMVTLVALGVFGYIKGRFTGTRPLRSALQTVFIGGIAATAAFLLANAIS
jgi:vacuolar iron transporter family protein